MKKLWWKTIGNGNFHLVLLHGWGMNAEIWNCISSKLVTHFTLHLVDLPGFGRSQGFGAMCVEKMVECILQDAPKKAIWLGWSFGGLIVSQIALMHPERVQALVTVASSPHFSARIHENWPGIKPEILTDFQLQLCKNFQNVIKRFLVMQTLGTKTAKKDSHILKNTVLKLPFPDVKVLNGGLEILKNVDLREPMEKLLLPHLRIYGYLDSLVPYKVVTLLNTRWPKSDSLVIRMAAHTPFISHPTEFCTAVISLSYRLFHL